MPATPLATVLAFSRAFDERAVDRAAALLAEDVEAVTPRGVERGRDGFRAYMARQTHGVTPVVETRRYFQRGDAVVIGQRHRWIYVETGEPAGPSEDAAAIYVVRDGLIVRFQPFADLASALGTGNMSEDDEVASDDRGQWDAR